MYGFAWMDNGPTYFLSTFHSPTEQVSLHRRVKRLGERDFEGPRVAADYNANMGGVDLSDQKRAAFTCTRRYVTIAPENIFPPQTNAHLRL